jgi:hypothetical protein
MNTMPCPDQREFAGPSMLRRALRPLQAAAIAMLLLLPSAGHAGPNSATQASDAHVYLLRGVLNIFSLGLDDIAERLRQQGIPATVSNYLFWSSLADEAAADYRSGRVKTIILVGHSSGATYLPDMVARLNQLGAPVKLAIGLDSVFHTSLSGRVGRYINLYIANGAGTAVARTRDLKGTLENVNVDSVPGVGHISIDKNHYIQQKVIGEIDAVVFNRPASGAQTPAQSQAQTAGTAAKRGAGGATARN